MPDPETDELRALQQKAYGRGGGLTDAEAARLRELEADAAGRGTPLVGHRDEATGSAHQVPAEAEQTDTSSARSDSPPASATPAARGAEVDEDHRSAIPGAGGAAPADAKGGAPAAGAAWRTVLRGNWKAAATASALLLAVGLGAGWVLFAPHVRDAVQLTEAEVQRKFELGQDNEFDEGTLRAIARDDDALVWFGTQDDGEQSCIVLDVAGQSQMGCSKQDEIDFLGLSATVSLPPEDGAPEDDYGSAVSAYAMFSTTGEPLVSIQRWDNDSSMLDQFDEAERPRAEALVKDERFQISLSLVGYLRDQPVWLGDRLSNSGSSEKCLVADALGVMACGDDVTVLDEGLSVGGQDDSGRAVQVVVQFTNWGSPYLTITENVGDASTTVIDTETGDPIEVTTPQTDPDG